MVGLPKLPGAVALALPYTSGGFPLPTLLSLLLFASGHQRDLASEVQKQGFYPF